MSQDKKLILVIGATGAQGMAVIDGLLAPKADGGPSPYAIRALTRDTESRRAKALSQKGVELVQGSTDDLSVVFSALQGCYGVWVNTDSFTLGEDKETWQGIRIFELAKQAKTLKHYIYSHLDYAFKETDYNPKYSCDHYNAKGRVGSFMQSQPSEEDGMTWSLVSTGPYMEQLDGFVCGPVNQREDGTVVFATLAGQGHVPFIALKDLGFFARYAFDHRSDTSAQDLKIASDMASYDYIAATFTKVTGKKAVVLHVTEEQYFSILTDTDLPLARDHERGDGSKTWRENITSWWALYRDDVVKRDMAWVDSVNPNRLSVEKWMRETNYTGQLKPISLKNVEDGLSVGLNVQRASQL